jgi:hypothetical protein
MEELVDYTINGYNEIIKDLNIPFELNTKSYYLLNNEFKEEEIKGIFWMLNSINKEIIEKIKEVSLKEEHERFINEKSKSFEEFKRLNQNIIIKVKELTDINNNIKQIDQENKRLLNEINEYQSKIDLFLCELNNNQNVIEIKDKLLKLSKYFIIK